MGLLPRRLHRLQHEGGIQRGPRHATARITAFEQLAEHKLAWVYFSQQWYRGLRFPRERVLTIWRHGAVPYIAFLPSSGTFYGPGPKQQNPERRYTLQRIIDGVFDPQLRAWADGARKLDVPLLLSFGAEVNDEWGPWNARWNGADQTDGYGDPTYPDGAERYRDAYRHLVKLFRARGGGQRLLRLPRRLVPALNGWNTLDLYYPGDAYVDWLGISVYGTLDPRVPMSPFARKIDVSGVYRTLTRLSRRPIAIAEMGTVERAAGEKAAWIRCALPGAPLGPLPTHPRGGLVEHGQRREHPDRLVAGCARGVPCGRDGDVLLRPAALLGRLPTAAARRGGRRPGLARRDPRAMEPGRGCVRLRGLARRPSDRDDDGDDLGGQGRKPGRPHTYKVRAVDPGGRSV